MDFETRTETEFEDEVEENESWKRIYKMPKDLERERLLINST